MMTCSIDADRDAPPPPSEGEGVNLIPNQEVAARQLFVFKHLK